MTSFPPRPAWLGQALAHTFPYAVVVLLAAAFLYPFTRVLWRVGDEGIVVYGALRVSEGAVPFRDFFEVMGPGCFYWLGLFFVLFGATFEVARSHLLLTGLATTAIGYHIARRLMRGPLALIPPLFICTLGIPQWPASSYHWDSNLFLLTALAVWLHASRTHSRLLYFLAGAFGGATALFMMQKGALIVASLLFVTIASRSDSSIRPRLLSALAMSAGAVTVLLSTVWFYWSVAALGHLVSNVLWPFQNYLRMNSVPYGFLSLHVVFEVWKPVLAGVPPPVAAAMSLAFSLAWLAVPLLPVIVAGLMAVSAISRPQPQELLDAQPLALGLGGWALWLSEIHRWDFFHLAYASPVLVIYCCYLLDRFGSSRALPRRASFVCLIMLLIPSAAQLIQVLRIHLTQVPLQTRRGTVILPARDEALLFLLHEVRQRELVFVYPNYSMYYFLADVVNPTRVTSLMYGFNTRDQFFRAVADLEQSKTMWVMSDTFVAGDKLSQWFPAYQQPPAGELIMEEYLDKNYKHLCTAGGFQVLKRKGLP